MFDIGFTEMILIGVVILVVVGPERLPKVAHTVGLWFGKARGFLTSIKADIDSELRAEELKRILNEQAKSSGLHEIIEESKNAADDLKRASSELGDDLKQQAPDVQAAIGDEPEAENRIQPPVEAEQEYLVRAVDAQDTQAGRNGDLGPTTPPGDSPASSEKKA